MTAPTREILAARLRAAAPATVFFDGDTALLMVEAAEVLEPAGPEQQLRRAILAAITEHPGIPVYRILEVVERPEWKGIPGFLSAVGRLLYELKDAGLIRLEKDVGYHLVEGGGA